MYHKNEIKVLNNKKVEEFAKFINLEPPLTYNLKEVMREREKTPCYHSFHPLFLIIMSLIDA